MPAHTIWQEFYEWGLSAAPTLWTEKIIPLANTDMKHWEHCDPGRYSGTWKRKPRLGETSWVNKETISISRTELKMPTEPWHLKVNLEPKMPRDFWMSSCCNKKPWTTLRASHRVAICLSTSPVRQRYGPSKVKYEHSSWLKDWKPAVDQIDLDNPYWNARWEPCVEMWKKEGPEENQTSKVKDKHVGNVWSGNIRKVTSIRSLHCRDKAVTGNCNHGFRC